MGHNGINLELTVAALRPASEKSKTHGKGNKNYKTVPCARYAAGNCQYDEDCWFIHDEDMLSAAFGTIAFERSTTVTPPPKTQSRYSTPSPSQKRPTPKVQVSQHPSYRTQPCYHFKRSGACPKGNACTFRHDDSVTTSPVSPISVSSTSSPTRPAKQPCFDLIRTGTCPKGEQCIFSHEMSTQRYVPWLRRVECKLFLAGNCKHGDTCLFKHSTTIVPIPTPSIKAPFPSPVETKLTDSGYPKEALYRTKSCRYYQLGKCTKGSDCTYIHDHPSESSSSTTARSRSLSGGSSSSTAFVPHAGEGDDSEDEVSDEGEPDDHDDDDNEDEDDVVYQPPSIMTF